MTVCVRSKSIKLTTVKKQNSAINLVHLLQLIQPPVTVTFGPRSDLSKTSTKNYFKCKLENLLNPTRLKIMPLPRLQIYLLPRVTSTFDFLTTKVGISHTCPMDHLWQLSPKSVYLFSKSCIQNLVTNKRPNIWTNGEVENIVPSPARQVLAWRTHNIINSFIYYNCKLSHDNTVL